MGSYCCPTQKQPAAPTAPIPAQSNDAVATDHKEIIPDQHHDTNIIYIDTLKPQSSQLQCFFDMIGITDDIRYLILKYLSEEEIHLLAGHLNHDWNQLAKNTFNHSQFNFTFKNYHKKLLRKRYYRWEANGSRHYNEVTTLYIQAPWNYLWIKVDARGSNSNKEQRVTVEGTRKSIPFIFPSHFSRNIVQLAGAKEVFSLKYEVDPAIKCFFNDGYHHIMPESAYLSLNTKIETRFYNFDLQNVNKLYKNRYGQVLVDVIEPPILNFYQYKYSYSGKIESSIIPAARLRLLRQRWICGIVDMNALRQEFPLWDWNDDEKQSIEQQNNKDNNSNKINSRYYQIPIIIDVTERIVQEFGNVKEKTKDWINVYYLGKNRVFTRIWYQYSKKNILNFGEKSNQIEQEKLLATCCKSGFDEMISDSQLTLSQISQKCKNNEEELYWQFADGEITRGRLDSDGKRDFIQFGGTTATQRRCPVLLSRLFRKYTEKEMDKIKSGYFYDKWLFIDHRPIIHFDLQFIIDQIEKNYTKFAEKMAKEQKNTQVLKFVSQTAQSLMEDNNNPFLIKVSIKPKHIALFDLHWNNKWSAKRLKLEKSHNGNFNNRSQRIEYQEYFPMCYTLIDESTFYHRQWKYGTFELKVELDKYINMKNVNERQKEYQKILLGLTQIRGQIQVKIDITNEFNQFQDILRMDWMDYHNDKNDKNNNNENNIINEGEYKQEEWDNRKYFMNSVQWDKDTNKIFYKYWVHFDDVTQIQPQHVYKSMV